MINITTKRVKQSGVTSIFIVIFATLLLSVITISFTQLMVRESQRSSDDELSQSAYDSAMAGVEDAKRVVMLARSSDNTQASRAQQAIDSGECNTIARAGVAGSEGDDEILVQSTDTGVGSSLNQAYTCVTIEMDSDDYQTRLDEMRSVMIPLKGVSNVRSVKVDWHSPISPGQSLQLPCGQDISTANSELCQKNSWGSSELVPALMRSQFITPGNSITYGELNTNVGGNTVFLYPSSLSDHESYINISDFDRFVSPATGSGQANSPQLVECAATPDSVSYHCSARLRLNSTIAAGSSNDFLRLTAIYNSANVRVTLLDNNGSPVQFDGVQPVVDSTGRANDLFRRVEARLGLVAQETYPEFAVDIHKSLCKDFYVSSSSSGRVSNVCSP